MEGAFTLVVTCQKCGVRNRLPDISIHSLYRCGSCGATLKTLPLTTKTAAKKELIAEFIQALDEEIQAIKTGKGSTAVRVSDGQLIREEAGFFLYSFTLESFLTAPDDTPVDIKVGDSRYPGRLIQSRGMEVIVGVKQDIGSFVPEALLITNLHFLPEMLKKKFEAILEQGQVTYSSPSEADFSLANLVFEGGFGWRGNIELVFNESELNKSQRKAVEATQSRQLTIVWGPPGTGKTKTLAYVVGCFVKRGMRVLVVAHSNAAVDEVTEKIAEVLRDTEYYRRGQIVRLGVCGEKLKDKFVSLERIVEEFSSALKQEQQRLERRRREIEGELENIRLVMSKIDRRKGLSRQLVESHLELDRISAYSSELEVKLRQKEAFVEELLGKLKQAESSSRVKRFFLGLNPTKIREELEKELVEVEDLKKKLNECEGRRSLIETQKIALMSTLEGVQREINELLGKLNVSEAEIREKWEKLKGELEEIQQKLNEIQKQLEEIRKKILAEARVICTTLTKTFSDKEFPDTPFDVLVVDEASMAPMPYLYWALSKCRRFAIIAGDFFQLPPICISDEEMAKKWLGRSIYTLLNVDRVASAMRDERVRLLDVQYRMNPEISGVVNELFYENKLKDAEETKGRMVKEGISNSPLTIIDTSSASPWCNRLRSGSRINIYSAVLSVILAERVAQAVQDGEIAIITPYAAQAKLINKILGEKGLKRRVRVGTVHRFQGGEADVVIFDTVEGPGTRISPLLDDTKDGTASLLINVALTRAKCKVFLIANTKYLRENLPPNSKLRGVIDTFEQRGESINSEKFVDSYFTSDFERCVDELFKVRSEEVPSVLYREKNFYSAFFRDLMSAKKRVIIVSPFISIRRLSKLAEVFRALVQRGVEVKIYTRPPDEQTEKFSMNAEEAIRLLRSMGVDVVEQREIHYKVAIIDDDIEWEGSLNILSHRDTKEQMRRFKSRAIVEEVLRELELGETSVEEVLTFERCPKCGKEMVIRLGRRGPFLSCPDPDCSGKRSLSRQDRIKTQVTCPDCNSYMVLRWSYRGPFLGCSNYPNCKKTLPL